MSGHANVPVQQFLMEIIVLLTLVKVVKFGIKPVEHVYVLEEKYLKMVFALIQKLHVNMEKYGTLIVEDAHVLMVDLIQVAHVKQSKLALEIKSIIQEIINVNALLILYFYLQEIFVEIPLALMIRDGMDLDVYK